MPSRKKASAWPERIIEFPQLSVVQRLRYVWTGDSKLVCNIRRYCRKCGEWVEEFPAKEAHGCKSKKKRSHKKS